MMMTIQMVGLVPFLAEIVETVVGAADAAVVVVVVAAVAVAGSCCY